MPKYRLLYHPLVLSRDIPRLDSSVRTRLRTAIEKKLTEHPEAFAKPLANTTQRLWSLRAGDWRVIFALRNDEVWIVRIGHRRDVYSGGGYPEPPGEYSVSESEQTNENPVPKDDDYNDALESRSDQSDPLLDWDKVKLDLLERD